MSDKTDIEFLEEFGYDVSEVSLRKIDTFEELNREVELDVNEIEAELVRTYRYKEGV